MSANWHVREGDRARLRAELADLDARLHELDQKIRESIYHHRYSRDPGVVERAAHALKKLVSEMDRLMIRMRAVEGKLLVLQKRSESAGAPSVGSEPVSDEPGRLVVDVYRDLPDSERRG